MRNPSSSKVAATEDCEHLARSRIETVAAIRRLRGRIHGCEGSGHGRLEIGELLLVDQGERVLQRQQVEVFRAMWEQSLALHVADIHRQLADTGRAFGEASVKFAQLLSQGSPTPLVEFRLDKMYEAGFSANELEAAELMADDLIDRYRRSLTFWEWLKIMPCRPRLGFGMRRRPLAP